MTVIVFDGKTMAADGRTSRGSAQIDKDDALKLAWVNTKKWGVCLCGFSGRCYVKDVIINALIKGKPLTHRIEYAIMVYDGKRLRVLNHEGGCITTKESFILGSGTAAAQAALLCGKGAAGAVQIACQIHNSCGGTITSASFDQKPEAVKTVQWISANC